MRFLHAILPIFAATFIGSSVAAFHGAQVTPQRHWIDKEAGLSMALAEGFAVGPPGTDGQTGLSVESSTGGIYRICSARTGPDGEDVAATIQELGADPKWVRSVCEDTAYPPGQPLKNKTYLAGATDDGELGPRHSCVIAYEVDDAELRSLDLSYVIRQASVISAGPQTVNLNCSLAAKDAVSARAHWQAAEADFGAMRGSIARTPARP
ncbi:hypothetical protein [Sphingomonas soli]|uniref:hypothetical protein n=1 Tax=Sphingomonas soli TaxID=266127 RepID=UPI000834023D|nr:hypothetical protein [Sphingomonas soli]